MITALQKLWNEWSGRRHPVLLVLTTLAAAIGAAILLIGTVDTPAILYQAF